MIKRKTEQGLPCIALCTCGNHRRIDKQYHIGFSPFAIYRAMAGQLHAYKNYNPGRFGNQAIFAIKKAGAIAAPAWFLLILL